MQNDFALRTNAFDAQDTLSSSNSPSNLSEGEVGREYIVKSIETNDEELKSFLFTLGCFEGEPVSIVSKLTSNFVICVKDARYSIDDSLARCIAV